MLASLFLKMDKALDRTGWNGIANHLSGECVVGMSIATRPTGMPALASFDLPSLTVLHVWIHSMGIDDPQL